MLVTSSHVKYWWLSTSPAKHSTKCLWRQPSIAAVNPLCRNGLLLGVGESKHQRNPLSSCVVGRCCIWTHIGRNSVKENMATMYYFTAIVVAHRKSRSKKKLFGSYATSYIHSYISIIQVKPIGDDVTCPWRQESVTLVEYTQTKWDFPWPFNLYKHRKSKKRVTVPQ